MTLDQFIAKYTGKKLDYDNAYGGQCVDLYRFYLKEVLQTTQTPPVVGASEIFDTAGSDYERIVNTPDGVPQKGDIVIWNKRAGGGFGHVAVFIEGNSSRFKSFDQNWRALNVCEPTEHTYTNVRGWLRFITMPEKTYTEAEWQAERDERNKNWDLFQAEKADHDATKAQLDEEKQSNAQFIQTLASKLTTIADEGAIVGAVERLLAVEDQLLKCRKDYTQLEKEKFMLEADKNREIAKLKAEVDAVGEQLEQQQEENTRLATQVKQLSERIDDLLDQPKPQKPISGNPTGLQKLLNSIKSVVRRLLWLEK